MKIYRAEISTSFDSCSEFWESMPVGDFHTSKEAVLNEIAKYSGLTGESLECALRKNGWDVGYISKYNRIEIVDYDLIED
jgi:hypothetical protein